eukprot:jgi/Mesen1/2145/ME000152S01237
MWLRSVLPFVRSLVDQDASILRIFAGPVLNALGRFVETNAADVLPLVMDTCHKLEPTPLQPPLLQSRGMKGRKSKLAKYVADTIQSAVQVSATRAATVALGLAPGGSTGRRSRKDNENNRGDEEEKEGEKAEEVEGRAKAGNAAEEGGEQGGEEEEELEGPDAAVLWVALQCLPYACADARVAGQLGRQLATALGLQLAAVQARLTGQHSSTGIENGNDDDDEEGEEEEEEEEEDEQDDNKEEEEEGVPVKGEDGGEFSERAAKDQALVGMTGVSQEEEGEEEEEEEDGDGGGDHDSERDEYSVRLIECLLAAALSASTAATRRDAGDAGGRQRAGGLVGFYLDFAFRFKGAARVVAAVADFLESVDAATWQALRPFPSRPAVLCPVSAFAKCHCKVPPECRSWSQAEELGDAACFTGLLTLLVV